MQIKTFRDLHAWVQTAETDRLGQHILWPDSTLDTRYCFHIYLNSDRGQMNVCRADAPDLFVFNSIGNIIFGEEDVRLISVKDGVADYGNQVSLPLDTNIAEVTFPMYHGGVVKEVLRDFFHLS